MAIKVSGTNVIDNNQKGLFTMINFGSYSTSQLASISGSSVGDTVYDTTLKKIVSWNGSAWV